MFNFLELLSKLFFFTGYFTKNASYPQPLPPELEQKYLALAAQGDENAREELINHNLRLVAHIAKKYSHNNDLDDLLSVGGIGLVKGINTYKLGRGTALATYLVRCIENEILMMLRANKRYHNTVYLQDCLGTDSEGNAYALMDVLAEKEDSVFAQVETSILSQKLQSVMEQTLTPRERQIITLRYGLGGDAPQTQLEAAKIMNISRSYISRIETRALSKMRGKLSKEEW